MQFLNQIYTSPIRSWLRHLGVASISKFFSKMRTKWRYLEYEKKLPKILQVQVGKNCASLLVSDKTEYARILSVNEDNHIIKCLMDFLNPGDCYWDVGGNIGLYTVLLAKSVGNSGKVIAFEPEERAFKRLLENIQLNELINACPLHVALGEENKKMKLNISEHFSSGSHSLVTQKQVTNTILIEEIVEVCKGDDLRKEKKLEVPTAMKVDVEGAEYEVLKGLSETLQDSRCRLVVCEVHFSILESCGRKEVPSKIQSFLKDCGFDNQSWIDHSHLIAKKDYS